MLNFNASSPQANQTANTKGLRRRGSRGRRGSQSPSPSSGPGVQPGAVRRRYSFGLGPTTTPSEPSGTTSPQQERFTPTVPDNIGAELDRFRQARNRFGMGSRP